MVTQLVRARAGARTLAGGTLEPLSWVAALGTSLGPSRGSVWSDLFLFSTHSPGLGTELAHSGHFLGERMIRCRRMEVALGMGVSANLH